MAIKIELTVWFHAGAWRVLQEGDIRIVSGALDPPANKVRVTSFDRPQLGAAVAADAATGTGTTHLVGEVQEVYWLGGDLVVVLAQLDEATRGGS